MNTQNESICERMSSEENNNEEYIAYQISRIKEANVIFCLLPYFDKFSIFRRLTTNKKIEVLSRYIEKAVTLSLHIPENVFHVLNNWQENKQDIPGGIPSRYNDRRNIESCKQDEIIFVRKLTLNFYSNANLLIEYEQCIAPEQIENVTVALFTQSVVQSGQVWKKIADGQFVSSVHHISQANASPVDINLCSSKVTDKSDSSDIIILDDEPSEVEIISEKQSKLESSDLSKFGDSDFKEDTELWQDAQHICEIVPGVQLHEIYEELKINVASEQRKLLIIEKYLGSGESSMIFIKPTVTASQYLTKRKTDSSNSKYSKRKKFDKAEHSTAYNNSLQQNHNAAIFIDEHMPGPSSSIKTVQSLDTYQHETTPATSCSISLPEVAAGQISKDFKKSKPTASSSSKILSQEPKAGPSTSNSHPKLVADKNIGNLQKAVADTNPAVADVNPGINYEVRVDANAEVDLSLPAMNGMSQSHYREFLFVNNLKLYRLNYENGNNLESKRHLSYFDKLKNVVPYCSDKFIAKAVLKCRTGNDLQETIKKFSQHPPYDLDSLESNEPKVEFLPTNAEFDSAADIHEVPSMASEEIIQRQSEDDHQKHTSILLDMFPDADPDYIKMRVHNLNGTEDLVANLADELSSKRNYPTYENYLKKKKENEMRQKFIEGMSVEEFLEYFNGNEDGFTDKGTHTSEIYKLNTISQIKNDFPCHMMHDIHQTIRSQNYKYYLAFNCLKSIPARRKSRRPMITPPVEFDDAFLKERCYVQMMDKINEHKKSVFEKREKMFEKAKADGELQECQCCYDDEVLICDMSPCSGNGAHLFCNNCIRSYSEEQIGQSKLEFVCLNGTCTSSYNLEVLKSVLKPAIFSNLLKRMQAQEIAAADIPDLVSCPFCNFATIMPNPEDKVFKCLNPECQKDSCRLCKERNHVPLKCKEFEKQKQVDHRTYLENEMTKAILRECYKCKKSFIKEEGCNKMACSCGAIMCYLCKAPITGYDHFTDNLRKGASGNNKCPLWTNSMELHANELKTRVEELRSDNTNSDPVVHNPLDTPIPEVPQDVNHPGMGGPNVCQFHQGVPEYVMRVFQQNNYIHEHAYYRRN